MKRATALVVVLMFAVTAWGYQASSGASNKGSTSSKTSTASASRSTAKSGATAAGAKQSTIVGCLRGPIGEGYYAVKNVSTRDDMQVDPVDGLKAHVGHQVKLTGTWKEEIAEIQERRFQVSKVEMISETCGAAAAKKSATAKPAETKSK